MRFFIATSIIILSSFGLLCCNTKVQQTDGETVRPEKTERELRYERIKGKALLAKEYIKSKKMNDQFCILIDFSIHSGKDRLFVWDFVADTMKYAGLCCHGIGGGSTHNAPVFSNVNGSNCSSLGRYKIGIRSYSNWGINVHYKLHGQDPTNNNASKRIVVLHSYTPIPNREIYPRHLPLGYSLGCPVVSDELMRNLDTMLKTSVKPTLLWIYNE